ncbi:hypothetical protein [Foetidibacter luteolus]|uniref:hypothetical protein n=1 Tax=Foetidibacter luteolus TaxID=2608880 RepID=UPI001A9A08D9|nr:hypothetical protein [Foetidibacter luteolus]
MENNKLIFDEVTQKILQGLDLVSKRLIEDAKKNNRELVVYRDNKIVKLRFSK